MMGCQRANLVAYLQMPEQIAVCTIKFWNDLKASKFENSTYNVPDAVAGWLVV